ncbi:MAG TPA: hypothetical protein VG709_00825 [Actinomycetota bacterium]|nr:hypothetical protein [Actinomycetota bacterium]
MPGRAVRGRLRLALTAAAAVWLALTLALGVSRTLRWTDLGRIDDVDGVAYLSERRVFVVRRGNAVLVLSAISPHRPEIGEPLFYCPSGYFVGPHGEIFDQLGRYIDGPAPTGMDRFQAKVEDGFVLADLRDMITGPARSSRGSLPAGRQCILDDGITEPRILPAP